MGAPFDDLVPVALLYENTKGFTFEEFYLKVKRISYLTGDIKELTKNKYVFAERVLNLPKTKNYKEYFIRKKDKILNYFKERFFPRNDGYFEIHKCKRYLINDSLILETWMDWKGHLRRNGYKKKIMFRLSKHQYLKNMTTITLNS